MELTTLRLFPSHEQRRQVLNVLRSIQGPTSTKAGCRCCRICEEDGQENAILYMECWDSREEFERHVRSDMFRRVLQAMELSGRAPDLKFHQVVDSQGMELLNVLRTA